MLNKIFIIFQLQVLKKLRIALCKLRKLIELFIRKKASKHLSFEIDLLRPYDIKTLGNI